MSEQEVVQGKVPRGFWNVLIGTRKVRPLGGLGTLKPQPSWYLLSAVAHRQGDPQAALRKWKEAQTFILCIPPPPRASGLTGAPTLPQAGPRMQACRP